MEVVHVSLSHTKHWPPALLVDTPIDSTLIVQHFGDHGGTSFLISKQPEVVHNSSQKEGHQVAKGNSCINPGYKGLK